MIKFEWVCSAKLMATDNTTEKRIVTLGFMPNPGEPNAIGCQINVPEDCAHSFQVGERYEVAIGDPQAAAEAKPPEPCA